MQSLTDTYTLKNGVEIPCIGLGTWQTPDGETAYNAVRDALSLGYRHVDTAAVYRNEASVGRAVTESGIPREEIFVTSKLWNTVRGYDETKQAFEETLERLGLDYLDLYLIHWPNPAGFRHMWKEANAETWRAMEDLYKAGRIRAIGISNFLEHHINALLETAEVVPMVNQIRLCPGDTKDDLVAYCRKHGMLLEAYSPFGTGKAFQVPEIKEIAAKYNKTVAQLLVRWSLQMGFLPLPKSTSAGRIKENADVFDFEIDKDDVVYLARMKGACGESWDPDAVTW
ncbi:MAG TPA: aldo/keto reductase [Firmicutes bacterium]|jgi:diketogulonate reductase-like aldo/keto reductase|nr:aldo/keto reductase [Candidatus Fermentithermobacillaceae bacterium]